MFYFVLQDHDHATETGVQDQNQGRPQASRTQSGRMRISLICASSTKPLKICRGFD